MKPKGRNTRFAFVICLLLGAISASATTFTTDAYIGPTDFSSDGQDIIVTNCTLTIDGAHGFNSFQLLNGGVLTHSAFTNGPGQIIFPVNNESQTLATNTPATLVNTNVNTNTIVVMDSTDTITYTPNVDYLVTLSNQFTQLTLTTNSAIANGATVLVSYDWSVVYEGFALSISNNMDVAPGGLVNLSGMGYAGGNGFSNRFGNGIAASQTTNSLTAGGGGGHGGCGGMSTTFALGGGSYDSTVQPSNLGSGGGTGSSNGGAGGGFGQLSIGSTLQLDGQILANGLSGTNANSGGGAGGGLLIFTQTFSGAGTISAQGGSGDLPNGGGGGGGTIAIYSTTNTFTGSIIAYGGAGANYGGAGTIIQSPNGLCELLIANNGVAGTNTLFSPFFVTNLIISGSAIARPQSSSFSLSNLFVGSNSTLLCSNSLSLTVNGDVTVESNAFINGDSKSASGLGNGNSSCGAGAGGSYVGVGGNSFCGSSSVYIGTFSITAPSAPGSLGGGSPAAFGGGAIILNVSGTLSLNGQISANGQAGIATNGGGGSGGSVFLTVGAISGNGTIAADGGNANNPFGGGGGGGAVAVVSASTNLFAGLVTAYGGTGANAGGAGTVFLKNNAGIPQLTLDNDGVDAPTNTATLFSSLPGPLDLTVRGGAVMQFPAGATTLRNLFIASNGLVFGGSAFGTTLTATNVVIQSGGALSADSESAASTLTGQTLNLTGGGAGNGGYGGISASNALGAASIVNAVNLYSAGSVGGNGRGGGLDGLAGGRGGGLFVFSIPGILQLDGTISANGGTSDSVNSGGGSGGGIKLAVATLSGAGTISANGGAANNLGGGGGGGRIAIYYVTNLFSGNITAYGGPGANYGGAGTIYEAPTATFGGTPSSQLLLVDNGGIQSTNTGFPNTSLSGVFDFIIRGGALVSVATPITNGNLTIGSNSVFIIGAATQQVLDILTNATIQARAAIRADGNVLTFGGSTGQSLNSTGGGGGYGGIGGSSILGAQGGLSMLDSYLTPTNVGSLGGNGGGSNLQDGRGGGGIRLIVNGALQLDGIISAQGSTGLATNSGGGSGGSVWVSAGSISGAGIISVNGGTANGGGGGGGGGRIAVDYNTNFFTGSLTAFGGGGANYGGAGTIHTSSSFSGTGQFTSLTIDNGGNIGQATLINPQFTTTNWDGKVIGGATLGYTNPLTDLPHPVFGNLLIGSNSTCDISPLFNFKTYMIVLTNATVQPGGAITVQASGSLFLTGPFNGGTAPANTGGGGGHGGYGGYGFYAPNSVAAGGSVTDSVVAPTMRGGTGGPSNEGGPGGGVMHLVVYGVFQLDGVCSANGGTGSWIGLATTNYGGGAGGAIWLQTGELLGAGSISANGNAGTNFGGGGGGGRIAIWANTNLFSGPISARGGAGVQYGGPGTIYFNSNTNGHGASSNLVIDGGQPGGAGAGIATIVNGLDALITNGATLTIGVGGMDWNSLIISSNSLLTCVPGLSNLTLTINTNLLIPPTAAINLDGEGFAAGSGPGAGQSVGPASGGGHGGFGGLATNQYFARGGSSYDSITAPVLPGSGGGYSVIAAGSTGGGALNLNVNGLLEVDGSISANGLAGIPVNTSPAGGGGAGGSLLLTVGTLSGSGSISANGGAGVTNNGSGAGGRIAIYFNSNTFTGTLSAHAGSAMVFSGGAGTIFLQSNSASVGQLYLDNGGLPGTNTPLDSLTQVLPLSISNGAIASMGVPLTLQSLSIGSNAALTATPQNSLVLTVLNDAFVDTNAAITATGMGYTFTGGPGGGGLDYAVNGSGGGYGGMGGNSILGAAGGGTYGSSNQPVDFGSGGGVSNFVSQFVPPILSSPGGGAIRLLVDGTLTLNGNIAANGIATTTNAGGGAGGSIWLTTQALAGNGSFTANGGSSATGQGGGGGGGRIAIYANTNSFFGSAASSGGAGAFAGQPGTVVIATNLLVSGSVTDTNDVGITGITLQPSGLAAVTTDSSGSYSFAVPLFWTGTVAPTNAGFFVPNLRNYSSIGANFANQNYLLTSPTAFNIGSTSFDGTNLNFNWYGINGVTYQPLYSSNLVNWLPYGPPFIGSNAPAAFSLPVSTAPQLFFRLSVSY